MILFALMLIIATGCSKNDDGINIDKTYADDDFTKNQRNIKEKLIGSWEFEELKWRYFDDPSITKSGSELGDLKYLKVKTDGSAELLGMEGVKWRMEENDIIVSRKYLVGKSADGLSSLYISLGSGNYFGEKRSEAEKELKSVFPGGTITTEELDIVRLRVKEMQLNYFNLEKTGKTYGAITSANCKIRRR